MSKSTLVVSGTVINQSSIEEYKSKAIPILKKHGGSFPPRTKVITQILAGEAKPKSILEVDFPTEADIINAFNDPDYLDLVELRNSSYQDLSIYITK